MIARRLGLVVLAVAVCSASTGCRPATEPPVGNQKGRPSVQEQVRPAVTRLRLDDDSIRVGQLLLEAVQKDLGLTDDQIGKIGAFVTISKKRWREFLARLRDSSSIPALHARGV